MPRGVPSPVLVAPFAIALVLSGCVSNRATEPEIPVARSYEGPACPPIVVQSGAQARIVYSGGTADPARIRYQVGILDVARTCTVLNDVVSAAIDVSGRFVGGPAAQAGTARDTVRVAIVGADGAVVGTREYAISGALAPPLYGQDFRVTDSIPVPAAPVGIFYRVIVSIEG